MAGHAGQAEHAGQAGRAVPAHFSTISFNGNIEKD